VWRPSDLSDGSAGAELVALSGRAARLQPGPCYGPGCDHASNVPGQIA
jgi:hypothetical protein